MIFPHPCANFIFMIFVLVPIAYLLWTYFWVSRADVVEGKVIDFEVTTDKEGSRMYAPKVVCEIDGESRELTSILKTNVHGFRIGESIKVVVSRDRKRTAIATYIELYGIPIAILVLLFFIRIGSFIFQHEKTIFYFLHPRLIRIQRHT